MLQTLPLVESDVQMMRALKGEGGRGESRDARVPIDELQIMINSLSFLCKFNKAIRRLLRKAGTNIVALKGG